MGNVEVKKYLIDTNVLIDLANGRDRFSDKLSRASCLVLSPVVHAEFLTGIRDTALGRKQRQSYERFLAMHNVSQYPITHRIAERYAEIKQLLMSMGTPVPTSDIWIAAQAQELSATVVTSDSHFRSIPLLDVLFVE